jgi:uncharacterized protein YgbK (DUF1537 family)
VACFILSDDLTGASGVASMVDGSLAVTVNVSGFDPHLAVEFPCVVINLEARERSEEEVTRIAGATLDMIGESWTALRIDSALRGPVAGLVRQLSSRGRILLTDTIPEYVRSTSNGKTIVGSQEKDLKVMLEAIRRGGDRERVIVADSQSEADLRVLASRCVREGLIPVDPGPLVSMVVKERLRLSGVPPQASAKIGTGHIEKVAFVIGTREDMTVKQLQYMEKEGFAVRPPASTEAADVSIFSFSLGANTGLVDDSFVSSLRNYDAIVLSGGATASLVLERSGFDCIVNGAQIQPLLSSGIVRGGMLDGKLVVLKGGFIGDENTYKTILGWLKQR